jgi:hypothetical protein
MMKYFREGMNIYGTESSDNLVYACAAQDPETHFMSVLAINRNGSSRTINFAFNGDPVNTQLRRYLHNPGSLPGYTDGYLQEFDKLIDVEDGEFSDEVPSNRFAIYTNDPSPTGHDPELPVVTIQSPRYEKTIPAVMFNRKTGVLTLQSGTHGAAGSVLEIYGLDGKKVLSVRARSSEEKIRFADSGRPAPGQYVCRVREFGPANATVWKGILVVAE